MSVADHDLIRRVLAGEVEAFDLLVGRYQAPIFRLTYRMTRNAEDAKDLAQEAFVQAYRGLGSFRQEARFSTWLYRIAMNLCLNHQKAAAREVSGEPDERLRDERKDSLAVLEAAERDQALEAAIAALPPQQRATLTLRVQQGLSHREIAETLGCAEGTAKANYFHAIRTLQRKLQSFRQV
ncbi:MAG: sigma-70 family RNA polymerase sigma factor [candidate division NC10 bacterium]|nr:sigma-70 family RNA polymerase sigma factor [candidate division NC10 bacterium]